MRQIKVQNGLILVEKYDQIKRDRGGSSPFRIETNDNLGIIKYVDMSDDAVPKNLVPGVKIYFGPKYAERLTVEGVEIYAMKPDNVIAVVEEVEKDEQAQS
jgi:hypothetical protein